MSHNFYHELKLEALYCEEEHLWEEVETEEEEGSFFSDTMTTMEHDISWEDQELKTLLSKEKVENNPCLSEARYEAVEWILKVVSHYSFSALTALLAVNYFDRFLSNTHENEKNQPWMTQLVAVACISLAAKVEEIQVPLLLDLQVEESKYVFEAKTIQRMELLVLSTLQWKMNPVNPISFLDYIMRRLAFKNQLSFEFMKRCENLLLGIISDSRFMSYLPSVMATATMLHVIKNMKASTLVEFQDQLFSILGINKEKVHQCYKEVNEVASTIQFYSWNKRKYSSLTGSPKGVMDIVSFGSSNNSNNDSSPQPLSKKSKPQEQGPESPGP